MYSAIEKVFDAKLKSIFNPTMPEVFKFLVQNDRKRICIENICYEIRKIELRTLPTVEEYRDLIESIAVIFGKKALQHKQESLLTENERIRRVTEADKAEETRKLFYGEEK